MALFASFLKAWLSGVSFNFFTFVPFLFFGFGINEIDVDVPEVETKL